MRFNAVCFNDCMKNAGISGLREMHITNESCQYPSEHTGKNSSLFLLANMIGQECFKT